MKVGIIGGGQLALMLARAAKTLQIETVCLDPSIDACASQCSILINAAYDDKEALKKIALETDIVTYENENIETDIIDFLSTFTTVFPDAYALKISQDRYLEKNFIRDLDILTTPFFSITSKEELKEILNTLGFPALLKTRRFGYDGKGQVLIKHNDDIENAWENLKNHSLILEKFISFDRELSLICVRDKNQHIVFYPLTENTHHKGILRLSRAPLLDENLQKQAEKIATKLCSSLNYIGVLAIEFFQVRDQLLINEVAPRVHNSGHWTIEGSNCSQFENHLRAICGLDLIQPECKGYSAMINCIGEMPNVARVLHEVPDAYIHDYQKTRRENRKVGHITLNAKDKNLLEKRITAVNSILSEAIQF